jgi:hypothetical protein
MDPAPAAPVRPLFLVGMPRSGTKLLRDLLNQHPLIGLPEAETELLPDWARRWPSFGDLSGAAAWAAFTRRCARDAYFVHLEEERGLRLDADAWRARCKGPSLPEVFEGLCRLHGGAPEGGVWGDKSPGYIRWIPLLSALWPRALVVHLVRDARDHALSMQQAWGKDPVRAAARWARGVEGAGLALQRHPGPHLVVRYEDLVRDPAVQLRRVLDALGLPWSDGMDRLRRPAENLGDAAGSADVLSGNVEKWRTRMAAPLRARIEAICAAPLAAHGYPVAAAPGPPPRRAELAARQLADGWHLLRFEADQRGLAEAARFRWQIFRRTGAWELG